MYVRVYLARVDLVHELTVVTIYQDGPELFDNLGSAPWTAAAMS